MHRTRRALCATLALAVILGPASAQAPTTQVKIDGLPPAVTPLTGAEGIPCTQGGVTRRCAVSSILGVYPVIQALTVTGTNALSALTGAYDGRYMLLFVNGGTYTDHDASPLFSISGSTVVWNSANAGFSLHTGDRVTALYTVSH